MVHQRIIPWLGERGLQLHPDLALRPPRSAGLCARPLQLQDRSARVPQLRGGDGGRKHYGGNDQPPTEGDAGRHHRHDLLHHRRHPYQPPLRADSPDQEEPQSWRRALPVRELLEVRLRRAEPFGDDLALLPVGHGLVEHLFELDKLLDLRLPEHLLAQLELLRAQGELLGRVADLHDGLQNRDPPRRRQRTRD